MIYDDLELTDPFGIAPPSRSLPCAISVPLESEQIKMQAIESNMIQAEF